jgi:hypothetical protein
MDEARRIVRFRGGVSCRHEEGLLGLTLVGRTPDKPDETATLAFAGNAPANMPEALEDATVEQLDTGRYRIRSGRREWTISASSAHLHRDVVASFYRAITPRPVPWGKRVFWRLVLGLAAIPLGRRLLLLVVR